MKPSPILLTLPTEVVERALSLSRPSDVACFAQTCKPARELIYCAPDNNFWRQLYLAQPWDDLRISHRRSEQIFRRAPKMEWMEEVQRRTRAARIARNFAKASFEDRKFTLTTFLHLIETAPAYCPEDDRTDTSQTLEWLADILDDSEFLSSFSDDIKDPEEQELRSRLKAYVGLSEDDTQLKYLAQVRRRSRCFIYNLKNYGSENFWGTFRREKDRKGNVHWYFLDAALNVVTMNYRALKGLPAYDRPPKGLQATRAYTAIKAQERRDPRDWAGVEGHWQRYVCFMDYRDLFAFNFATSNDGPLNPSFFDEDFQEAIRLIDIRLHIVDVIDPVPAIAVSGHASHSPTSSIASSSDGSEWLGSNASSSASSSSSSPSPEQPPAPAPSASAAPGEGNTVEEEPVQEEGEVEGAEVLEELEEEDEEAAQEQLRRMYDIHRPTIYFNGVSSRGTGNEARVTGTVRMTPDGQIRWRFKTIYDGQAQWSSEGVQIGNVCSAAGLAGTWTGANHQEGDPAGPFWMWKVPDDHEGHDIEFD